MFVSGVVAPPGGRRALVKHVEELFTRHAPVCGDAISNVVCLGPLRAAGRKNIIVKFTSVKEKEAAFRATAALRRQKVYLDDDLTKAQQARRRPQEPERQAHIAAGRQSSGAWTVCITLRKVLHLGIQTSPRSLAQTWVMVCPPLLQDAMSNGRIRLGLQQEWLGSKGAMPTDPRGLLQPMGLTAHQHHSALSLLKVC
ncbi:hypothetical protein WJX74_008877 [Apatococcus lobatus]|uniref:RRM domain-containing protein n=1 Tax=Apatococcus lobatus TaxID=904363 RepID=A0AAW1QXP2_9CHLO